VTDQTSASPNRETQKIHTRYTEEGSFPRLQERVQTQLGFLNNLLITLAVALLAFAANASANSSELQHLDRYKWLIFFGMILLACSVLMGIELAHNRLQSYRITTRTARLRQLRDRLEGERRPYETIRLAKQASFFAGWAKRGILEKKERDEVGTAAKFLEDAIPERYKKGAGKRVTAGQNGQDQTEIDVLSIAGATTKLIETLRAWSERADDWTWIWLGCQTWCFIIGALLLLMVSLIYYA
jgi:hypothetical protein